MMLYSKGSKVFPFVFVNATIIWMYTGTERLGFQGFPWFFSKMYPPELCLGPTIQSRSAARRAA